MSAQKFLTRKTRKQFISAVKRENAAAKKAGKPQPTQPEWVEKILHASTNEIQAYAGEGFVHVPEGFVLPTGERRKAIQEWKAAQDA